MSADIKSTDLELEGFHGTPSKNVELIKKSNFQISRGDDHWLGEGSYFFEDGVGVAKYNALNWAKLQAHVGSGTKVSVLRACIKCEKSSLLDLTEQGALNFFQKARRALVSQRKLKPQDPQSGRKFDNVVIEKLAKLHGFKVIKCWFYIKLDLGARLAGGAVLSGVQNCSVLCVRSPNESIHLDEVQFVVEECA